MSFVASIFEAIVDIIVWVVEAVVQIVETIVHLIMVLLGWDSGGSQTIEYYEVHNIPLFDDSDKGNPLLQSVLQSVIKNEDIASHLIYHSAFRSLKGDVKAFMQFIDDGNYFESFPTVESFILVIDYTELTAALNTLNGVPCTPEQSALRALSNPDWVKYWLQENKAYNVGTNTIDVDYSTTSEDIVTITPSTNHFDIDIVSEIATADAGVINGVAINADTVIVTPSTNHFDLDITSEIASSDTIKVIDSSIGYKEMQVDLNTIVYNSGTDDYTVKVYNATGLVLTLPYTVPTKPLQLHYVSFYYRDSAPSRQYIFIYKVGTGVYTDLDTVENPIDQDGATLEVVPAIPLRISNANYTTFGTTKKNQIEDILAIIHLNAEEIIDAVMNDPDADPGDIDNVYVNFGVRMWDTSQTGLSYLYNMFENLYPSQGVTQGIYNNAASGDDKPANNIITETADNKYLFQWSYITYTHTSLAAIDADSGSVENGIYYSDMSRFDADDILVNPYYVSSGKGTYNVGYKADNLTEVAAFLAGSGVVNPGTTTSEATNWMQPTTRLPYNNPSPVLQESDGSTSTLKYLTPDLVYENNGSGGLRLVQQASEETTHGQSITYYCCKPSGLDAYTVSAPVAGLRVIDGASGRFNMVRFNLGAKDDLMVPFIHTMIKDLSNQRVSQLFLAGAHVSIYIAHYEVIVYAGMSWLLALVMIIIIVVVAYFTITTDGGSTTANLLIAMGGALVEGAIIVAVQILFDLLITLLIDMVVQYAIQKIITMIAPDDPYLQMLLQMVVMVGMSMVEGGVTYGETGAPQGSYGNTGGAKIGQGGGSLTTTAPSASTYGFKYTPIKFKGFSAMTFTATDFVKLAMSALSGLGTMQSVALNTLADEMSAERSAWDAERRAKLSEIQEMEDWIDVNKGVDVSGIYYTGWAMNNTMVKSAELTYQACNNWNVMQLACFDSMHDYDPYTFA